MSVVAYRVIKIERAEAGSFKLGDNTELLDFLGEHNDDYGNIYEQLSSEGAGMVNVAVSALKKAIQSRKLKLSPEVKAALKADIAWAEAQDAPDIQYECF